MNPLGFVLPAASIGLGALLIKPRRGLFPPGSAPLIAQATIEERHLDELEITEHPVEQGAAIADHAYKRPAEVVIRWGWSNSPSKPGSLIGQGIGIASAALGGTAGSIVGALSAVPSTVTAAQSLFKGNDQGQVKQIYQQLLQLQADRTLFDVFTGKRSYTNMLLKSLTEETNPETENSLIVTAVCRQVIIVTTQVVSLSGEQAEPEKTAEVEDRGPQSLQETTSMVPDSGTLSGAMNGLNSGFSGITETLSSAATGVLESLPSPISQLDGVISQAQEAVSGILDQLPPSLEIPLLPNAQELGLSLESIDLKGALGDALNQMPDLLGNAQGMITSVQQQIPSIVNQLPASFDQLGSQLSSVQDQIKGALGQVSRVFGR